jgi:hypothetical protein
MSASAQISATHQAIGEFVIAFQWIENLYRQMGWFILDPERKQWPPMQLRTERNHDLINKVTDLYVALTDGHAFPNGEAKALDMQELRAHFHALRKFRNRLLHSTYIELKAGGEVHGYVRSNPEVGIDPESGELIYDQEGFSADVIYAKMREYAAFMFRLNINHVQLIHWHPFTRYQLNA